MDWAFRQLFRQLSRSLDVLEWCISNWRELFLLSSALLLAFLIIVSLGLMASTAT